MKTWIIGFLVSLFIPVLGHCGECPMTAQWEYHKPPTDLAGFLLYREVGGDPEAEISANITASESFVGMIDDNNATYTHTGLFEMNDGANVFRLKAYDFAGQVGPISESAGYDPAPGEEAHFILLMFNP